MVSVTEQQEEARRLRERLSEDIIEITPRVRVSPSLVDPITGQIRRFRPSKDEGKFSARAIAERERLAKERFEREQREKQEAEARRIQSQQREAQKQARLQLEARLKLARTEQVRTEAKQRFAQASEEARIQAQIERERAGISRFVGTRPKVERGRVVVIKEAPETIQARKLQEFREQRIEGKAPTPTPPTTLPPLEKGLIITTDEGTRFIQFADISDLARRGTIEDRAVRETDFVFQPPPPKFEIEFEEKPKFTLDFEPTEDVTRQATIQLPPPTPTGIEPIPPLTIQPTEEFTGEPPAVFDIAFKGLAEAEAELQTRTSRKEQVQFQSFLLGLGIAGVGSAFAVKELVTKPISTTGKIVTSVGSGEAFRQLAEIGALSETNPALLSGLVAGEVLIFKGIGRALPKRKIKPKGKPQVRFLAKTRARGRFTDIELATLTRLGEVEIKGISKQLLIESPLDESVSFGGGRTFTIRELGAGKLEVTKIDILGAIKETAESRRVLKVGEIEAQTRIGKGLEGKVFFKPTERLILKDDVVGKVIKLNEQIENSLIRGAVGEARTPTGKTFFEFAGESGRASFKINKDFIVKAIKEPSIRGLIFPETEKVRRIIQRGREFPTTKPSIVSTPEIKAVQLQEKVLQKAVQEQVKSTPSPPISQAVNKEIIKQVSALAGFSEKQLLREVSAPVGFARTRVSLGVAPQLLTFNTQIESLVGKTMLQTDTLVKQELDQSLKQIISPRARAELKTITQFRQPQLQRNLQRQLQQQRQQMKLLMKNLLSPSQLGTGLITLPFGVGVPILPPPIIKKKKKVAILRQQGYNVLGKPIRQKGYVTINKVPLTKKQAKSLGAYMIDTSLSTNFEIEKARKLAKEPKLVFPKNYFNKVKGKLRGFRIRKGQRIPLKDKWIERKGIARLDTPQEIKKITLLKRISDVEKKSRLKKKIKKKRKKRTTRSRVEQMTGVNTNRLLREALGLKI